VSAEARYYRVGVFLFIGIALVVVSVVVLAGQGLFQQRRIVETYFTGSVQGLEVGSPVKFRGVQVGSVKEIGIVYQYYTFPTQEAMIDEGEKILVRMQIFPTQPGAPFAISKLLARGMRVRLASQGITGVAYLELDFMGKDAPPPLQITWQPEYPYIPSAPSTIQKITTAAEKFFARLDGLDLEGIFAHADRLLVNLDSAVTELQVVDIREAAMGLLEGLRKSDAELRAAIADSDLPAVAGSARGALDQAKSTLVRAERVIDGSRYDLEATIENLRVTSENLRALTETLRNQPSLLLRSGAPEKTTP
jgi:paraquat-inducible protein B